MLSSSTSKSKLQPLVPPLPPPSTHNECQPRDHEPDSFPSVSLDRCSRNSPSTRNGSLGLLSRRRRKNESVKDPFSPSLLNSQPTQNRGPRSVGGVCVITYCSRATIFMPSSSTPVILLLMYCRTGAPCGVASVGMVKPVAVPAGGAGSGWAEAAREVGCCCCWVAVAAAAAAAAAGTGVGMRAIGAAGEGAVVGVVEVGGWGCCVGGCGGLDSGGLRWEYRRVGFVGVCCLGQTYCCDLCRRIGHGNVVRYSRGDAIDRLGVGIWGFRARDWLWRCLF